MLSLAVARAFCEGRERLRMSRAMTALRNAARARRLSSTAAARVLALRLSCCLRSWSAETWRVKHRSVASSRAEAFAADFVARSARNGARSGLRKWAAMAARRGRRQRGKVVAHLARTAQEETRTAVRHWAEWAATWGRRRRDELGVVEGLRLSRQRAAVCRWRDVCRGRQALATATRRNLTCLARLNARRMLGRWHQATFGGKDGGSKAGGEEEGGGEGYWLVLWM